MRGPSRTHAAAAGLLLLALVAPLANAATSDTTTTTAATTATSDSSTSTAASTTATSSGSTTAASSTDSSATTTTSATTDSSTTGSTTASTTTGSSTTGSSTSSSASSTSTNDYPTLAGATIPTLVIPYTADAPFMQKSNLPEGTVFIAVGAVLAFLGFCVVLWRGMTAWSINRSVKKAALASIMASDTKSGTGWLTNRLKPSGGFYSHAPDGSSLSLDALTASGKPIGTPRPKVRESKVPAAPRDSNLFFSPTASVATPGARNSTYLPAGYYASPSAQAGSGAQSAAAGGALSPSYQRGRSRSVGPSEPESPNLQPQRLSARYNGAQLQLPGQRNDNRASYVSSTSRPNSTLMPSNAGLYSQASSSSLAVGTGLSDDGLPGSRAPSAYLDDLFENHGNGPRERF